MKFFNIQALFICLISFNAHANNVTLAVEDSWPPYATEEGLGYSHQIVEEAFKSQGYNVDLQVVPYARALHLTKNGEVDGAFNVTRQTSTEAIYHFGQEPLLVATASFYTLSEDNIEANDLNSIPDSYNIGIINGYEYGDIFEENHKRFNVIAIRTQKQILEMMKRKRIDGFIMFDEIAKYTMEKHGFNSQDFKPIFVNHTSDIYVAFNKELPNKAELSSTLDKGIRTLKESGRYEQIFEQKIP